MKSSIYLLALIFACQSASASNETPSDTITQLNRISLSTGFGIPYAIIGVNLNYRILDELELFVGKGTWEHTYGVRIFPIPQQPKLSLSVSYGINTIVNSCSNESCDIVEDGYAGYNAAFGFKPETGQDGWEFDVVLILSRGNYEDDLDEAKAAGFDFQEEGGKIKRSGGYRWSF